MEYSVRMGNAFTRVGTNGRVTIPAKLRAALKIMPGAKIAIRRKGNALLLQPLTDEFIESLCGYFKGGPSLSDIWEREHRDERY